MSFPRYPKYKDSGVRWMGEIPVHWDVLSSRRMFSVRSERAWPADKQLTASQEHGVLYQEDYVRLEGRRVVETIKGIENLLHVEPNDFVISMRSFQGGIEWSGLRGSISFHYVMLVPSARVYPPFFAFLLKSTTYIQALRATTDLIRDGQELRYSHFVQVPLPVIPLEEQKTIADFLNRETAKIDALITEQERLIDLLKEKRQAVISHAVTKGLNPSAPTKDSGLPWLGSIPAHWSIVPFASAVRFQEGPGIMAADFLDAGVPLLRVAGVQGRWATLEGCNYLDGALVDRKWAHFRVRQGDLLISASATMGTVSEVTKEVEGAVPYTGIIRLMPVEKLITRDYVRALVQSSLFLTQIDLLKAGATIQHFGPTHLRAVRLALPPKEEQTAIAAHLDVLHTRFDMLIREAQRGVELLAERRNSLISAAVTGQIDVRGLAKEAAA